MEENKTNKPELLAPAGSFEGFLGCIAAGADAVYMGGPKFGARAYAQNLSEEEFQEAVRIAHLHGRKVYMTVNILTREEEMDECIRMVQRLWEKGLDGVIVQDLGVVRRLGAACPGLLLHASTQMSATTAEDARLLKTLGIVRVVPARECSLAEMKKIRKEGVEIECFIHGAMCYCYSGRCLMSSFLGGRSGNRGRCAGTCRLPYAIVDPCGRHLTPRESYPLSMKDMCVLQILPELIDAGMDSFKIEGRMKKPEYAAGVTAIYRKYIDRYLALKKAGKGSSYRVEPEDLQNLLSLYLRTDLSDGYYHRRNGRELVTMGRPGYSGASEELLAGIRSAYLDQRMQLPAEGSAKILSGQRAEFSISARGKRVTVRTAEPVQTAKSSPLSKEQIREKLDRTGDSDFRFEKLEVTTDGKSFLPVSALNRLRRDALEQLSDLIGEAPERTKKNTPLPILNKKKAPHFPHQVIWILVSTGEQLLAAKKMMQENVRLILDGPVLDELEDGKIQPEPTAFLALPQIFRDSDREWMEGFYKNFTGKCAGFLARTLGEIEFLSEKGYDGLVMGDASLYAWNRDSADFVESCTNIEILPLELSGKELLSVFGDRMERKILPVYGHIPMMVTAGCVRKTAGVCTGREEGVYGLLDRKDAVFPVRTICRHCMNIIYNSVPLSLHHLMKEPVTEKAGGLLIQFTVENQKKTEEILHLFLHPDAEKDSAGTVTIRTPRDGEYTTGHFRKGVL